MRALLLAAGIGSRLLPITATTPKCLVLINGRPLLDYWLELLFGEFLGLIVLRKGDALWSSQARDFQDYRPGNDNENDYSQEPGAEGGGTIAPEALPGALIGAEGWLRVEG